MTKLLKTTFFTTSLLAFFTAINAQTKNADKYLIYKKTAKRDLGISIYLPTKKENTTPLIIFFHGGGWNNGTPEQFLPQAIYYKNKGVACALVAYRLKGADNTDPFTALADAKSAVRFLKKNAANLQIDTTKIILAGGSAGGYLAAACQWVNGFNDSTDNLTISTKGIGLILFNP